MPYTRTTWQDYPNTSTPITAARLNNIESFLDSIGSLNGAWTSYTPTWTNLTVGNGVQETKYVKAGRLVVVNMKLTFGSTTSISAGSTPEFSLPVALSSFYSLTDLIGSSVYVNINPGGTFQGCVRPRSDLTGARLAYNNVVSTVVRVAQITNTVPTTWAQSDVFSATLVYESAS